MSNALARRGRNRWFLGLSEIRFRAVTRRAAGNPAIGPGELLHGVPEARIVNAAFTHPGPDVRRFQDSRRGVWYGEVGFELGTRSGRPLISLLKRCTY